jgi:23S rRNA pseudouridine1911/1915/1917 synthase
VPRPNHILLGDDTEIPILYEDRSVIAIDKPPGWMLVPHSWQNTKRNLQAAIVSSIGAGEFWARSRNIKFLRYIHRLDSETSGVLLFGRSQGAMDTYGRLFESRQMEKFYLAVVHGKPKRNEWTASEPIGPDPMRIGRMRIDPREGKQAETHFRVMQTKGSRTLLECHPVTGRTHQIRLHALASDHAIVGDELYGPDSRLRAKHTPPMGLRSVFLGYIDPFTRKPIRIEAPADEFVRQFGFSTDALPPPAKENGPKKSPGRSQ